jgi:hypothetical protein
MGKILDLKSWDPVTYSLGDGTVISFELKRLTQVEAKPIVRLSVRIWALAIESLVEGDAAEVAQKKADAMLKMGESVPDDLARKIFAEYVRGPKGGPIEGVTLDGEPLESGADLYKIADTNLMLFVVGDLAQRATLKGSEGKGSSSPSTSSVGAGQTPSSPGSDAGSTGNGSSTEPSTAMETQKEPERLSLAGVVG